MKRLLLLAAMLGIGLGVATAQSNIDGSWVNVDPHTGGVKRVDVSAMTIHPFGTCHPTLCDWGILAVKPKGNRITAQTRDSAAYRQIEVWMEGNHELRMRVRSQYFDRRRPQDLTYIFQRED
jgi:hypothetical protein